MIPILAFCSGLSTLTLTVAALALLALPANHKSWSWIDTGNTSARRTLLGMILLLFIPMLLSCIMVVLYR